MKIDTNARSLFFSTAHITATADGTGTGTPLYQEGTGFFYNPAHDPKVTMFAPLLVTARHVIEGAKDVEIRIIQAGADGEPKLGKVTGGHFKRSDFIDHPNPQVDLTCLPLGEMINVAQDAGVSHFIRYVDSNFYPAPWELAEFDAIETITFVGYPDGQFDRYNRTPIARRGTTASPIQWQWSGQQAFLIDASVFPGSSGSPVYYLRPGAYATSVGLNFGAPRVVLLGVLTHRLETSVEGGVEITKRRVNISVGIDLGLVANWTLVDQVVDAACARIGWDRGARIPPPSGGLYDKIHRLDSEPE